MCGLMRRTPGLGDILIDWRINQMITAGQLRIVEKNTQNPYRTVLCANRPE